ncbi:MAG: hypothetical protein FJ044_01145 [Candidatus Cloacimonetes bacterium]|nr:hypothetical protein [Candidatus Cloacimonadota bacterium]
MDTVIINGMNVEILTGCGPGNLGYGTGLWIDRKQIFSWGWPNETAAVDGHEKIKTMLQAISDALRERPLETFGTAYDAYY